MATNATSFSSPLAETIFPIANLPPQLVGAIDAVTSAGLATWFFTILALAVAYDQGMFLATSAPPSKREAERRPFRCMR